MTGVIYQREKALFEANENMTRLTIFVPIYSYDMYGEMERQIKTPTTPKQITKQVFLV